MFSDEYFMKMAYQEAQKAALIGEVPIGAVIVCNNMVIARGHNQSEMLNDVTAHAEMLAFTAAANTLGGKYLTDCTLYVTLEPCPMCAGAAFWTQLSRVVFGAFDSKRGYSRLQGNIFHPKTIISGGIMEPECGAIIKEFFAKKR